MSQAEQLGQSHSVRSLVMMMFEDDGHHLSKYSHLSVVKNGELTPVKMKKHRLSQKQEEFLKMVEGKYKKAARVIRSMFKHGINMFAIRNGINPFSGQKSNRFMYEACELLLMGGFTRAELRQRLERQLSWKTATAHSHVLVTTHALNALGIVEEQAGRFTIKQR